MQNKLWRLAAGAMMVAGLAGCSTLTDTVSQTWNKTWSSLGGKAPAESKTPRASVRAGLQPSQESSRWQGLYSLEGETGRFQECTSGQIIPVLAEGDSVLLEQAYLNTRSHVSATMLAEVVGRVQERPVADPVLARQGRKMLALRVERFVALSSKTDCAWP
ncbi:hypothetical protein [Comamonas guangdongensis]|uniref:NlpE C-terminal OB domain-containing protein n=1 Tax=Comamonas guangdongensis TaxID=510515 RepID=A0ABV3ZYA4_9BURK